MMHSAAYRSVPLGLVALAAAACGDGGPTQPPPGPTVASIEVTPNLDTLVALGATSQFTAVARDASGNPISGQTFTWLSSAPSTASVDATGLVTAEANGNADITASIGNVSGSASVVVAQEVDEVVVTPGSASLTTVGATQQFAAEARDANANPITGLAFLWVSSNPSIATVDQLGLATAIDRGEVTITAAARGVPGNAALTIALRTYVLVSAGERHTCGLTSGGDAYCWGDNADGQLGDASNNPSSIPVLVSGGYEFAWVSAGAFHTCGATTTGEAFCWGANADGQRGDNSNNSANAPVVVAGGRTWDQVDGGEGHTCGVESTTGDVYCWGRNTFGQLGDGTTNPTNAPLQVAGVQGTAVSAGDFHSCSVDAAGTAQCWGNDAFGELGDGPAMGGGLPVFVMSASPLASIDAGTAFTCSVDQMGQGLCWGINSLGELGNGTGVGSDVPVPVGGGLGFSSIDAGVEYACGISFTGDDGYCWGNNDAFQLGNGTGILVSGTPVLVSGAFDFASVSTGRAHTCAVTTTGDAYCWGLNLYGQLGDGTTFNSATPVRVVE